MADPISDETFIRNVLRIQLLTEDRIQQAKEEQFHLAQNGELLPLSEVLVRLGDLTAALRERIEKMPPERAASLHMLGPFKLLRKIGEGSMGTVYLALDTRTNRKIALKTLPKRYADDSEFLVRFQREARAAQTIVHENIVAAYEAGEDQGYHYFAMEFCQGEPLDRILAREHVLPWLLTAGIMLQVARGLQCAHAHGFIHRDVKPANIIMVSTGQPKTPAVAKLLDLGLTKNISNSQSSFKTEAGALLGTPQYISPEQARGDVDVDGRSDIYSLGATFYHLATGEAPFQANSAELVIQKHLNDPLINPQDMRPDIPDGVSQVIQRMMAKSPDDRYMDVTELIEDLELVLVGKAPQCSPLAEHRTTVQRRKALKRQLMDKSPIETLMVPSDENRTHQQNLLLGTWGLSRGKRLTLYSSVAILGFATAVFFAWYTHGNTTPAIPVEHSVELPSSKLPALTASPPTNASSSERPAPSKAQPLGLEVLLEESFETLNLAALPANWSAVEATNLTLVSMLEHGQTLAVSNAVGASARPGVDIVLPLDKVKGRMVRVAVQACCPKGFEALEGKIKAKPGLTLSLVLANGYRAPEETRFLQPEDRGWKRLSITASIPQTASEVKINLSVPGITAEVFFDDLKVELLPEN